VRAFGPGSRIVKNRGGCASSQLGVTMNEAFAREAFVFPPETGSPFASSTSRDEQESRARPHPSKIRNGAAANGLFAKDKNCRAGNLHESAGRIEIRARHTKPEHSHRPEFVGAA